MPQITFATQNLNKVSDAQKLLPDFEIEHINFDIPEIQSMDLQEIIEYKLKHVYEHLQKPCFVMDTSLAIDCLNGFPGPFIKWFYEKTVGAEKICKIVNMFGQYGCQFTTTLGYFDGQETHFITETVQGQIATSPRGENGYHWDIIFIPEGDTRTFAEMTFEEKQGYAVTSKIFARYKSLLLNQNIN